MIQNVNKFLRNQCIFSFLATWYGTIIFDRTNEKCKPILLGSEVIYLFFFWLAELEI